MPNAGTNRPRQASLTPLVTAFAPRGLGSKAVFNIRRLRALTESTDLKNKVNRWTVQIRNATRVLRRFAPRRLCGHLAGTVILFAHSRFPAIPRDLNCPPPAGRTAIEAGMCRAFFYEFLEDCHVEVLCLQAKTLGTRAKVLIPTIKLGL